MAARTYSSSPTGGASVSVSRNRRPIAELPPGTVLDEHSVVVDMMLMIRGASQSSPRRRRTAQQQQERKSRLQIAESWEDWPLQSNVEDLGEDLMFQVYSDGMFSGLSFYVQLKSTKAIKKLTPKRRSDVVAYSFETKDLLHWEASATPVVLVVWDVATKDGVWELVPDALKALDASGADWRSRKSVRVLIQKSHTTDVAGREMLRHKLAYFVLPVLSRGKVVTISPTFTFPNTDKGRAAMRALRRTIEEGGRVTVKGEHIKAWRMSDWWERAFGSRLPDSVVISSSRSERTLPVSVHVICPERTESLAVELVRVKAGNRQLTFKTKDRHHPVRMTLVVHDARDGEARVEVRFSLRHRGRTIPECLQLTRLLIAAKEGGDVQMTLPGGAVLGQPGMTLPVERALDELRRWEGVLSQLSYIQSRIARFGTMSLKKLPDCSLEQVERLYSIVRFGSLQARMNFSGTRDTSSKSRLRLVRAGAPLSIEVDPFGHEELLGVRFPLGRVRIDFIEPDSLVQQLKSPSAGFSVEDTPVVRHYLDWKPPGVGPAGTPDATAARKAIARKSTDKRRKALKASS